MRNTLTLAGIAGAIALAVVVGNRLSSEAMAVVVGALCGISASIPVSIALVIAMSHNWGREEREEPQPDYYGNRYSNPHNYPAQPPFIVVSPPQMPAASPYTMQNPYYFPPSMPMPGAPREFKIVGEE